MKLAIPLNPAVLIAGLLLMAFLPGCSKESGEAIVVEKEYIAAGEELGTPMPGATAGPEEPVATPVSPDASPSESGETVEYATARPLAEDEVVIGNYVMKKNVRGTSKDPRAHPGLEQWRITVQTVAGSRSFLVQAKQAQYERLKVGDRVKVRYREGKYTGTVWSAEIVD
jgi:hypothetical protein